MLLEKVLRKGPVSQAAFKAIALAGDAKAAEFTPRLRPPTDYDWALALTTHGKLVREVAVRAMSCRVLAAIAFGESKPRVARRPRRRVGRRRRRRRGRGRGGLRGGRAALVARRAASVVVELMSVDLQFGEGAPSWGSFVDDADEMMHDDLKLSLVELLEACALATGGKEELLAGAAGWKPALVVAAEAKAAERGLAQCKKASRGSRDSVGDGDDDDAGAADAGRSASRNKKAAWSVPKEFESWLPEQLAAEGVDGVRAYQAAWPYLRVLAGSVALLFDPNTTSHQLRSVLRTIAALTRETPRAATPRSSSRRSSTRSRASRSMGAPCRSSRSPTPTATTTR